MTIILIVLVLILIVFLLADYKLLKNFFQKERDRNISFTSSQYQSYINNDSSDKITKEFVHEVIDELINVKKEPLEEETADVDIEYDSF